MIDYHKICFIIYSNKKVLIDEALLYINTLEIPEKYQIEVMEAYQPKNKAEAYNQMMKRSNAKYKVYLHESAFIVNKNIIREFLELFEGNSKLGMIGSCGTYLIDEMAFWKHSNVIYGKLFDNHAGPTNLYEFRQPEDAFEPVMVLHSAILVTQYDIPWNYKYSNYSLFDAGHCLDFIREGYLVGVPQQSNPWILQDCSTVALKEPFAEYHNIFTGIQSEELEQAQLNFISNLILNIENRLYVQGKEFDPKYQSYVLEYERLKLKKERLEDTILKMEA